MKDNHIIIDSNTYLQSADLYLQAAGSKGSDSTAGIHLRWTLKNNLQNHLPKGDFYQGSPQGNNKPDDYVRIYRTPYQPIIARFSFRNAPRAIVDNERLWLYKINDKDILVYFRNISRYDQVRATINPLNEPMEFLNSYGENLIEVESRNHLFFGTQLHLLPNVATGVNAFIKTEICSVETEQLNLPKNVTFRKDLDEAELEKVIFSENGRSIRFVPINGVVSDIQFQFYIDFIQTANKMESWQDLGEYSLSIRDEEVHKRLNPDPGAHPIHGKWLRYNDEEYVNIENYLIKWNGDLEDPRERIKDSVERYLDLSNDPSNPLANETYYLNDDPHLDNGLEISHLMVLQMAALDYHIARMLGMGLLDLENLVYEGNQFIYAAEYFTIGENGNEESQKNHVFLSLPTSLDDERLSLPIDLKEPQPGIMNSEIEVEGNTPITDEDGYAHDGKTRYVSLFIKDLKPDEPADSPFYFSQESFDMSKFTYPVYVGIEYKRTADTEWLKPELANDPRYRNVSASGGISKSETIAIGIPEVGQPAFIHRETRSGKHTYGSYGVNWFGRGRSSTITWDLETKIVASNNLLAPSAINALLIQEESPLFLTSSKEQEMLSTISNADKTFIRLLFEYDAAQDMITYHKAVDGVDLPDFYPLPDNEEIFANEIEVFFSPDVPEQIFGTIGNVLDDPNNPIISIIHSEPMSLPTASDPLYPTIASSDIPDYIGGILQVGTEQFIIHHIEIPSTSPLLPIFHVLKKQVGNAFGETHEIPFDPADFISPTEGASFMFTRNMLNTSSWGSLNPLALKVKIGNNWPIHHEEVTIDSGEGNQVTRNTFLRKFRGIVRTNASVKKYTDEFNPSFSGLYEITFPSYSLGNHPQYSANSGNASVQWYKGSIRIPYQNHTGGERKTLKVLRFHQENGNLILYALDENFETDPLQSTNSRNNVWVNFYPGYRVYLYHNAPYRLTENHILPQEPGVLEKYSVFGLRSRISGNNHYISRISAPTMMFARKMEDPKTPKQPKGALYATRPDYFGRATYTFTTEYTHEPYSVSVGRTNDDILLTSLYKQTPYGEETVPDSVEDIRQNNDDDFANDRLLDLANAKIENNLFPIHNGYRFPLPNNPSFFENINFFIDQHNERFGDDVQHISPGEISNMGDEVIPKVSGRNEKLTFYDFVKQTVFNSYVPLTEMPMIYQYINSGDYMPLPKNQCIRDRDGVLLKPNDEQFDIAPMMKKFTSHHKTLFTDFTLDGVSTSVYFYAVREINAQMKQGNWSEAIGPIRLVNSYAVKTPAIKSVIPVLENSILGIVPSIQIEINSYEPIHNIQRIKLYRALNMGDAMSTRSMALVKSMDLENEGSLEDAIWRITDDFTDLDEIPFGDPLYYRVTVEAKVEYAEPNFDYDDDDSNNEFTIVSEFAPSEPSKIMITTITENVQPSNPEMVYTASNANPPALENVLLKWSKQAYKGKYILFKMNKNGNWEKIYSIQSNEETIVVPLSSTEWGSSQLIIEDDEGNPVYHHFKVITENTAGMSGTDERILTVPSA